jgi:hypothetical protein
MPKPTTQKKFVPKGKASESQNSGSIVETESWLNISPNGKAVYLNIPEKDVIITESEYGKKVVMITSVDSLRRLLDGEIKGVKLGRFED